jgi:GTP-binding protein
MLVDEIEILIKGGHGGRGAVSFGKMAKSGPDGGNGGDGGNVYIASSTDLTLLSQFSALEEVAAEDGYPGSQNKRAGKKGKDLILRLPIGSKLIDLDTQAVFELDRKNQEALLCTGGEGGIGNFDMRSSTNTTPKNSIPAKAGQQRRLKITMSFIADYGLIGLPSAGKSSLLNELTNAIVKTASYDFTTISPNLGVLGNKKIMADIPGLIEGASEGKGLGIKFLKHIQKVTLLLHCISADSKDPQVDYEVIRNELKSYDPMLLAKKEIILLTKIDLLDEAAQKKVVEKLKGFKRKIYKTSIYDLDSILALQKIL